MAFDPLGALGDRLGGKVGSFIDTIRDVFGIGNDVMPIEKAALDGDEEANSLNWSISAENWYKIMGYQFIVTKGQPQNSSSDEDSGIFGFVKNAANKFLKSAGLGDFFADEQYFYTLPIPPQSIILKPVFANKVTPTVGGVVEEVSDTTFWMISMSGTTGIAVSRGPGDKNNKSGLAGKFREVIATTGLLAGSGANINRTVNTVGSAFDAIGNGDPVGAVNAGITPPLPYSGSAVSKRNNGFSEIKELEKFFFWYHRLKSKDPKSYKLSFAMYKTDQMWDVVVKDFNIQQNASNPHLYRYTITLQGWNVRKTTESNKVEYDRFGPNGDLQQVNTVGLAGMQDRISRIGSNFGNLFKP